MSIHFKHIAAMAHAIGLSAYPSRRSSRRKSIPVEHYRNRYVFNGDGEEWAELEAVGLLARRKMNQDIFPDSGCWHLTEKGIAFVERYMLTAPRDREAELVRMGAEIEGGGQ